MLRSEFLECTGQAVAGVVHHDIETPKRLHRLRDHALHLRRVRDIQSERAAGVGKLRGEFAESLGIPRGGHDALSTSEHSRRERRAEAAGAAGDQPDAGRCC